MQLLVSVPAESMEWTDYVRSTKRCNTAKKLKLKTNKQKLRLAKRKWPEDAQDIDVDTFFSCV